MNFLESINRLILNLSTDSESMGFSLIGIFFGRAKLHVLDSKDENQCWRVGYDSSLKSP